MLLLVLILAVLLLFAGGFLAFTVKSLLIVGIVLVVIALIGGVYAGPRYYRGRRGPMV